MENRIFFAFLKSLMCYVDIFKALLASAVHRNLLWKLIKTDRSEIIMVLMSQSWVHKHMTAYIFTSTPIQYSTTTLVHRL